jgi:holliday junction DNA helicase RuvA
MISYISGIAIYKDLKHVVIQTNAGVGYRLFVTTDTLGQIKENDPTSLWVHSVIREDTFDLYGFRDRDNLSFFELLLTVSGIGPKSALNILNSANVGVLQEAITTGETGYITKISGISKKIAEKIVLELKGKSISPTGSISNLGSGADVDTIEALKTLGYTHKEAKDVLENIPKDMTDTSDKIKFALKQLSRGI